MLHSLLESPLLGWTIHRPPYFEALSGTAGTLLMVLFLWRIWRFTLAPFLWPHEPKPLPYWVPLIGRLRRLLSEEELS